MPMPLPPRKTPVETDGSGELTDNETSFILDSCLKPAHRREPTVIAFIESFVRCRSIQQASAEAGIHRSVGFKYRHRKDIANAIQKITDKSAMKYGMDSSEIFERVREVVDFDPLDLQNPDGTWKRSLSDVPPEARRCIKKLKVRNLYEDREDINGMKERIIIGELIEYEVWDKLKASELVGREKSMFKTTTKVEHTVSKDMANILLESKKRAESREQIVDNSNVVEVNDYTTKGETDD